MSNTTSPNFGKQVMATDNQGDAAFLILVSNMANLVGGMRLCNAGTREMQLADLEG